MKITAADANPIRHGHIDVLIETVNDVEYWNLRNDAIIAHECAMNQYDTGQWLDDITPPMLMMNDDDTVYVYDEDNSANNARISLPVVLSVWSYDLGSYELAHASDLDT